MKKFSAILFLFIYLFATTELYQLLKVPLLVEHFVEHREENKHLTLWQFLYIHYAISDANAADHDKNMRLPFKSHDNCVSSFSNVYLPAAKVLIEEPIRFLPRENFANKDQLLLPSFLSNIWQPPRVC